MPKAKKSTRLIEINDNISVGALSIDYCKRLVKKKFNYQKQMRLFRNGITPRPELKSLTIDICINDYKAKLKPMTGEYAEYQLLKPTTTLHTSAKRTYNIDLIFDKELNCLTPRSKKTSATINHSTPNRLVEQLQSFLKLHVEKSDFTLAQLDQLNHFIHTAFNCSTNRCHKSISYNSPSAGGGCVR